MMHAKLALVCSSRRSELPRRWHDEYWTACADFPTGV